MGSLFMELYAEERRLLQLNPGARRRLSIWLVLALWEHYHFFLTKVYDVEEKYRTFIMAYEMLHKQAWLADL